MIFLKCFFLSALPSAKGIFQREGKSQSKNPNLEVVDGIEKKNRMERFKRNVGSDIDRTY